MAFSGSRSKDGAMSDAALIASIKAGEVNAFTALVRRHERSLINFFYHFSWSREAAEDCAQEVFLKLYNHLDSYEPRAKFTTFLYRVARNHWIDKVRAKKGKTVSLDGGSADEETASLKEMLSSPKESPVDTLTRMETADALKRALEFLPEDQRLVVQLSEFHGMKYQEIGEVLEVPVGTVKSRMFTAMQKLKDLLKDEV